MSPFGLTPGGDTVCPGRKAKEYRAELVSVLNPRRPAESSAGRCANRRREQMNEISYWQLCSDFLKAYFSNPNILILFIILILGVGVSKRFKKIEKNLHTH